MKDDPAYAPAEWERRIGRIEAFQELMRFLEDEVDGLDSKERLSRAWYHAKDCIAVVMPGSYWQYQRRLICRECRAGREFKEPLLLSSYGTWRKLVAAAAVEEAQCRQVGRPLSERGLGLRKELLLGKDEPLPWAV